jgi:multiple sugar transport system permease protein
MLMNRRARTTASGRSTTRFKFPRLSLRQQEILAFYLFISPWILGFLVFTAGPMISSLLLSLTRYQIINPPQFVGLANYRTMFLEDPLVWYSLRVTAFYAIGSVFLTVTVAFLTALLMNQNIFGISVFRTIFYLPSSISGVPLAILWMWVFNPEFGILNVALGVFGIQGPDWIWSPIWVIPAFIIMSIWNMGGAMVIFLAGLQGIPQHLYEAVDLDGGGVFAKFRHVTLPMVSPVIFFNLVMSIIGAFQTFTNAYVMTAGGPGNASLFYVLYLYRNAFLYEGMGYACALAWLLLAIILTLVFIVFKSSPYWVYYEGELSQ